MPDKNEKQETCFGLNPRMLFFKEGYRVSWSFHTTMNVDILAAAGIMALQYVSDGKNQQEPTPEQCQAAISFTGDKIAFFYNKAENNKPFPDITATACKKLALKKCMGCLYPLTREKETPQTFHTKISFVSMEPNSNKEDGSKELCYRLAVYSKNITFGSPKLMEAGAIFDLVPCNKNENGCEFQRFLNYTYDSTNKEGKLWLKNHGLCKEDEVYNKLSGFCLKWLNPPCDLKDTETRLWFGGLPKMRTLAEKMEFLKADPSDSMILTPPAFVVGNAQKYFEKNKFLYDCKKEWPNSGYASHIKMYLLKLGEERYRFCMGSANCTAHGIGYGFDCKPYTGRTSVECLVGVDVKEEQFNELKQSIEKFFAPFEGDFALEGSFRPPEQNPLGAFLARCTCSEVRYYDTKGKCINTKTEPLSNSTILQKIGYVFETKEEIPDKMKESYAKLRFWPTEYSTAAEYVGIQQIKNDGSFKDAVKFEVSYIPAGTFAFRPTTGIVLAGESNAMIQLPQKEGVPEYANEESLAGLVPNFVSEVLHSKDPIAYLTACEEEMKQKQSVYPQWKRIGQVIGDIQSLKKLFEQQQEKTEE